MSILHKITHQIYYIFGKTSFIVTQNLYTALHCTPHSSAHIVQYGTQLGTPNQLWGGAKEPVMGHETSGPPNLLSVLFNKMQRATTNCKSTVSQRWANQLTDQWIAVFFSFEYRHEDLRILQFTIAQIPELNNFFGRCSDTFVRFPPIGSSLAVSHFNQSFQCVAIYSFWLVAKGIQSISG